MKKLCFIILALFLCSCGSSVEGTYSDEVGLTSYTFQPNGKLIMSMMGTEVEMGYKIEDNKVKINAPQGTLVMKILEDGSIQGPLGVKLKKSS